MQFFYYVRTLPMFLGQAKIKVLKNNGVENDGPFQPKLNFQYEMDIYLETWFVYAIRLLTVL